MTQKEIILNIDGKKETVLMEFEDVLEQFNLMILKESNRFHQRYRNVEIDEIKQILTIECWEAFKRYDVSKGYCFSTSLVWRFKHGEKDLTFSKYDSKKAQFTNQQSSLDFKSDAEGNENSFANQQFGNDDSFLMMEQRRPDSQLFENELFLGLIKKLKEHEVDMINVILDDTYSIVDYSEKWNISRMGANKRRLVLIEKLKLILE